MCSAMDIFEEVVGSNPTKSFKSPGFKNYSRNMYVGFWNFCVVWLTKLDFKKTGLKQEGQPRFLCDLIGTGKPRLSPGPFF